MRFAIIVFPGSNCDHDGYYALKKTGFDVEFVWHKEKSLKGFDGILIPGGFSYGDYLRTGAIARFSPIMSAIISAAKEGKIIIGICNGFQILIEAGLLPGALIVNKNIKFISKNVMLKVNTHNSIFSRKLNKGQELLMPIAHKQGNYIAKKSILKELEDQDRIIFKYDTKNGNVNPNGSKLDIAGIINKQRNVLGMMPHPERASDNILGLNDGSFIFKSILG
tara:strand:+ start:3096 stop:3761 length:666 start_codon:yes stop_codon:yes gene_type:complete